MTVTSAQIRLNAGLPYAHKRMSALICSDVVFVTYVTPGSSFLRTHTAHAFVFKIGIITIILEHLVGVLLTETMLVTTVNYGPLPTRSQLRQIRAESGPARNWDHDTGLPA